MAVLTTNALTVRYGSRRALSALELEVSSGITGLLGQNGAGKSTLLKTLLGFIDPSEGGAHVLGIPVRGRLHDLRRRLGYFPERAAVLPDLTAVAAVALAGELGGLNRTDALTRAHEVLWFSGLGEARYRKVEEFSTGMLQRTKLAMALVHDPELLLLDEPTSGLDPTGRRQMLELIREVGEKGVSVLLSTHLLHDVEQVCDAVVLLDKGTLALQGELDALRQHHGWIYEVRVREEAPGEFKRSLQGRGLAVDEERDGLLRVTFSREREADFAPERELDLPSEAPTKMLFEVARATNAEIRHLRKFEKSLEEHFLTAITPDGVPA